MFFQQNPMEMIFDLFFQGDEYHKVFVLDSEYHKAYVLEREYFRSVDHQIIDMV